MISVGENVADLQMVYKTRGQVFVVRRARANLVSSVSLREAIGGIDHAVLHTLKPVLPESVLGIEVHTERGEGGLY